MGELSDKERSVLGFINDNTNRDAQFYFRFEDGLSFSDIENVTNMHPQVLTQVLKSLVDMGLVEKSEFPLFLAKLGESGRKNFELHTGTKLMKTNKRYYYITPKGERYCKKFSFMCISESPTRMTWMSRWFLLR